MKKCPYSWEDASYLTQRSLGIPDDRWRSIGDCNLSMMNFLLLGTLKVEEFVFRNRIIPFSSFCYFLLWILHA